MKKLTLSLFLVSTVVGAAEREEGIQPVASIRLKGATPLSLKNIFEENHKLETTLNYFVSTYPQSQFAQLNTDQKKVLVIWARETQILEEIGEEATALKRALHTSSQTDLGVEYTFNYFKTTYSNSDFSKLDVQSEKEVVLLAKFIKERCGFTSPGAINMAMRVPEKEIASIKEQLKEKKSKASNLLNNEIKPFLKDLNRKRKDWF